MGKENGQSPQHRAGTNRAQPAWHAAAGLNFIAHILGEKDAPHHHHRHHTTDRAQDQKCRQFLIKSQRVRYRQGKFGDIAKFQPVDHRARHAGNHNRGKGMHREMAQHHLERKQGPRNRGVETGRNRSRHRAAQQIAPGDPIGVDPFADPGRNHRGQMHHRALAPG